MFIWLELRKITNSWNWIFQGENCLATILLNEMDSRSMHMGCIYHLCRLLEGKITFNFGWIVCQLPAWTLNESFPCEYFIRIWCLMYLVSYLARHLHPCTATANTKWLCSIWNIYSHTYIFIRAKDERRIFSWRKKSTEIRLVHLCLIFLVNKCSECDQ